ncbi:MAG: asparagine synthase-related protein [Candidatus Melainabacteria bacterium]
MTDGQRRMFYVRERDFLLPQIPGFLHTWTLHEKEYDRFRADAYAWPMDFLGIEIFPDSSFTIQGGPYQFAPVFLVASGDTLYGDWDGTRLYPFLKGVRLNAGRVLQQLYLNAPYSNQTLFKDMYRLTQQGSATFSREQGLRLDYPEQPAHVIPRAIRPDADVTGGLMEVLQHTLLQSISEEHRVRLAVEFSGGVDSSVVIAVLRQLLPDTPFHGYTLLRSSETDDQTPDRRKALIQHCRLTSHENSTFAQTRAFGDAMTETLNVSAIWPENLPGFMPYKNAVICPASRDGYTMLFGGLGGDEACSLSRLELENQQPADRQSLSISAFVSRQPGDFPYVSRKAISALSDIGNETNAAPVLASPPLFICAENLNQGLWLCHPLLRNHVLAFMRSLPVEWRIKKRVLRETLLRLGFSREYAYPALLPAGQNDMLLEFQQDRPPMVLELFQESRLADLGYLDRDGLLRDYSALIRGEGSRLGEWAARYYFHVANLELAIRCVEQAVRRPDKIAV